MKLSLNLFPLFALLFLATPLTQGANVIPFQGQLTSQSGEPLTSSTSVTVVFRLYHAPVGATAIWEESQPNISVSAGRFSVLLGSRAALPNYTNFNATLYLGLTVDDGNPATTDVEMRPRQALVPVISATYAGDANNARLLQGFDWSLVFGVGNPTDFIPGTRISPGGIDATRLAERSITGLQISDATIGQRQLADNSVAERHILPGSVTTTRIAPGAVGWEQRAKRVVETAASSSALGSVALSATVHGWKSDSSAEPRVVQGLEVVLDTGGGPVSLGLIASNEQADAGRFSAIGFSIGAHVPGQLYVELLRDGLVIGRYLRLEPADFETSKDCYVPSSEMRWVDVPNAGQHRY